MFDVGPKFAFVTKEERIEGAYKRRDEESVFERERKNTKIT